MPKQTSLALVLALALTTAAGCGDSAREDALEVIDRVETGLDEIHAIHVSASQNMTEAGMELEPCHEQPNVRGVWGTLPFIEPDARQLQRETNRLRRECEQQRRTVRNGQISVINRIYLYENTEERSEAFQEIRSRIKTGPEDGLRRIMEEASSDEARWQKLVTFNNPAGELAMALAGRTAMPSGDVEKARETAAQATDAVLAAYEDFRNTVNRMTETAAEARRLEDEYMQGR